MPLTTTYKNKLLKLKSSGSFRADCCICGKPLDPDDDQTEYVKTKRGAENFFHRACVGRWSK